ncbi:MAG: hypothetical protein H6581_31540 [Bacteroidia bacterium]|nr:hypothetical protein [Bacteroidia bacterium]
MRLHSSFDLSQPGITFDEATKTIFHPSGTVLFRWDTENRVQYLNYENGEPKIIYFEESDLALVYARDGHSVSSQSKMEEKITFYDLYLNSLMAEEDENIDHLIIGYYWDLKSVDNESAIKLLEDLIRQGNPNLKAIALRITANLKVSECYEAVLYELTNETPLIPSWDKYDRIPELNKPEESIGELAKNVLERLRKGD